MRIQFKRTAVSDSAIIRLPRGIDIIEGIEEVCRQADWASAVINCCIGSLASAALVYLVPAENRMGSAYCDPKQLGGPLEVLSAQGMVGAEPNGNLFVHLHGSLCTPDGRVHGGHLLSGRCPVLYTMEIMLCRLEHVVMRRTHDAQSDMPVLMPFYPG